VPQYRPSDFVGTSSWLHSPAAATRFQPPTFPTCSARYLSPSAQQCRLPATPYPLLRPAFDVRGDARPYSDWALRRCRGGMSPAVEEPSASVERPLTTAGDRGRPVYGVDVYPDWDPRRRLVVGAGPDDGQSAPECGPGRLDRVSATPPAAPWATTAAAPGRDARGPGLRRSSTSSQRRPLCADWHLDITHARPETF